MYPQYLLPGCEFMQLTEQEMNFCNELVNGVDDDGQMITKMEAAKRACRVKTDKSASVRAANILAGGSSSTDEETKKKKKQAVDAYLKRLYAEKRNRTRLSLDEVIGRSVRIYDIAIGDERVTQTIKMKDHVFDREGHEVNLPAAKGAMELVAKLSGYLDGEPEQAGMTHEEALDELDDDSDSDSESI